MCVSISFRKGGRAPGIDKALRSEQALQMTEDALEKSSKAEVEARESIRPWLPKNPKRDAS